MTDIIRLDWDSIFFGLEVGKLNLDSNSRFQIEFYDSQIKNFQLIYIFSDFKIPNLKLVDEKVVLSTSIKSGEINKFNPQIDSKILPFDNKKHSLKKVINLGIQSGKYSRFKIDEKINNTEFEKLYTEWVVNSVKKKIAIETLIFEEENEIAGLLTLTEKNNETATIGLFSVDRKFRGRGIGLQLINFALLFLSQLSYKYIEVATQKINVPAMKIYEKAGFKIKSETNIYHYWNL